MKWIGFGDCFSFVLIYRPLFSDHQQAFVFTALICNSKAICNIYYLHVLTLDIPLTKLRCMSQVEGFNSKPQLKSVFFMGFYDQHPSSCMCYGGALLRFLLLTLSQTASWSTVQIYILILLFVLFLGCEIVF